MKRKFIVGSDWIYFKVYTGIKTADIILEEAVLPLIEYFKRTQSISKWFFIRYSDPKPHLRIRIKIAVQNSNEIYNQINITFQEYINSGEISNIVIDTYNREIERYGENTIESAETLFCKNSEFTLQCLHYNDEEKIIVSLFYIDQILTKLDLSTQEKLDWIICFNHSFKQEFNGDKKLNSQLDKKYREFKPKYLAFIMSKDFESERNFITANIQESILELENVIFHHRNQILGIPLQNLFQSLFHMNINRLFVSDQRVFEMIIYDYLLRYYKMKLYILHSSNDNA